MGHYTQIYSVRVRSVQRLTLLALTLDSQGTQRVLNMEAQGETRETRRVQQAAPVAVIGSGGHGGVVIQLLKAIKQEVGGVYDDSEKEQVLIQVRNV